MSGAPGLSDVFGRRHLRIGVTGLARAGKTAFLTSVAANLLAQGSGIPALPLLQTRTPGRPMRVSVAPSGAEGVPRFDYPAHLAALADDPPRWPERTGAVSLLALDLSIARDGLGSILPDRGLRLEFLDYPGEWLLDLPLLGQDFPSWSATTLRRLETGAAAPFSGEFRAFVGGLAANAPSTRRWPPPATASIAPCSERLRDEAGLSFLQPGRFLMPAPGPEPPWTQFLPALGTRAASPDCSPPGTRPTVRRSPAIWSRPCSGRWTGSSCSRTC